jgi:glycerate 2-kinase
VRDARSLLSHLFQAAVRAVDPFHLVAERLERDGARLGVRGTLAAWSGPTLVIGAGKAAAGMARAAGERLGGDLCAGAVIVPARAPTPPAIACLLGGHPLPSHEGLRSTREIIRLLQRHPRAAVLALISGGASSLMVQPLSGVTLDDKIAVTRALLASGADIEEFNTVRKHLSLVKGGGLARLASGRPLVCMLLSDLIGDSPSAIGSGPAATDPTTFGDALAVLERYSLAHAVPERVLNVLRAGVRGEIRETLKPGDPESRQVTNVVIGSNRMALQAAAEAAHQAGYDTLVADEPLSGETQAAARDFTRRLLRESHARKALCYIAGGETTVRLGPASGKGGRNQEFALVCAADLSGSDACILSAGTDGIDGPTDAAGAFADGSTVTRAHGRGLDWTAALANHDSYMFFATLGDLFRPGATGTNVMDIKLAVVGQPR